MKKIMKNNILIFILTLTIITSLVACSNDKKTSVTSEDIVKIAHIGPLTGDGQPWGTAEINSIKMVADEINEKGGIWGGKKIKIYSYDNRMDNVETTNAARKAINDDGVCAIIGTNGSSNAIALANICEQLEVPHVSTTATNPAVTVKDDGTVRPFSFRVTITDDQQGVIISKFATEDLEAKTAAILYEIGSDYSQGLKESFTEDFLSRGGEILATEAYKTGDVDFRAQFSKIKEKDVDVIFLPALYKEIALATSQARALGIESIFLGSDSWLNTDLFTLAPEAVEGAYYVNPVNLDDPILTDFKSKYLERYNEEAGTEGGNGFFANDALFVVIDAIERADSLDPKKIRDALETVKDVEGLTGLTSMNKLTHNPDKAISIFKIQINPNKFEFIKKINP